MTWFKRRQSRLSAAEPDTFLPDPHGWRQDAARTENYLRASGMVDETWYREQYADVRDSRVDPVRHYLFHGGNERRNPSRDFDTAAYVRQYPEAATTQPLLHFLRYRQERNLRAPRVGEVARVREAGRSFANAPANGVAGHYSASGYIPPRPPAATSQLLPLDDDDVVRLRRALHQAGFDMDPIVSLVMPGLANAGNAPVAGFAVILRPLALAERDGRSLAYGRSGDYSRYPYDY